MNVELVAQMFKNYQSNVLFHLEGEYGSLHFGGPHADECSATNGLKDPS